MNFFESQLRRLFGDTEDARFIGRCCFIPADDGNLVKAEFVTQGVHEEYVALQMSVINRADGVIDKTLLRFGDYFSRNSRGQTPYIPAEQRAAMEQYDSELTTIQTVFAENGLGAADISKAKTIFISCLTGKETEEDFYQRYADCFLLQSEEQSLWDLISSAFGVSFSDEEKQQFNNLYGG